MSSERCLFFAGIFFSYFLQVTSAYIACWLMNKALSRPRQRFMVWMAFLGGSAAYWIAVVCSSVKILAANGTTAGEAPSSTTSFPYLFLLPLSWSRTVLVASEVLAAGYLATILFLTMAAAWRHLRLRLALRHGRRACGAVSEIFDVARASLGISRCSLMVLPGITSPATVGWLRPRILLPTVCEEVDLAPRLGSVLHHELAHVARHDYFWAGVSDLISIFLFFHPAIWYATKRMRLERELACDSAVVEAYPEHRADYAESLAYFVRLRMIEERAALGLDFAASASSLGTRVRFILEAPPSLPWWKKASRTGVGMATLSVFVAVVPALTVVLGFRQALPAAVPLLQAPPVTARAVHRATHPTHGPSVPAEQDLASAKMRTSLPETPAYSLTSGRAESSPQETTDRPLLPPMNPPASPTAVSSVLRTAVGIVMSRRGGDHDHDRDRNGRPTPP